MEGEKDARVLNWTVQAYGRTNGYTLVQTTGLMQRRGLAGEEERMEKQLRGTPVNSVCSKRTTVFPLSKGKVRKVWRSQICDENYEKE